jgi:uncharacterized repeat protein (TIGR01451 family)
MCLRRRALGVTLLALLGCLPLLPFPAAAVQGETAPARLTQFPGSTVEPPLARPTPPPPLPGPPLTPVPVAPTPPPPSIPFVPAPPVPVPPPPPPLVVGPPVRPAPTDPAVPVVAIRVRVPACGAAGQELKYLICVENTSPAPAHHVLVRAAVPAGTHVARAEPPPATHDGEMLWAFGTLPGLCSKEIWLVLVPTGTDDVKFCARVQFEHGQCVCTRVARAAPPAPLAPGAPVMPYAEPPPGKQPKPPEKVTPPPKGEPRVELKITGPKQQTVNQPTTYTLVLTNSGTGPATKTLITASFPEQLAFVSATGGGQHLLNQVAWLPGTLEPGDSRTVDVVLKATAAGKFCVQAGALAEGGLTARDEACTDFKGAAAMRLKMVDTKDPIAVGEETSYKIEVLSQGSLPLTNVRVKAIVPDEMALVRAAGPTDNRKGARVKEGQEVLFDPYPSLASEAKITYEVFTKGVRPGDARFRVVVTADQLQAGGPVREEESTMIFQDVARVLQVRRLKGRRP